MSEINLDELMADAKTWLKKYNLKIADNKPLCLTIPFEDEQALEVTVYQEIAHFKQKKFK